ncbi:HAD-IA family hydrolase [Planktotalea sp.]|uniref:HAD-IA family hydrolase n=1 Tax=Planktotalea sp. TaxID=2029877 RepID=UPI0025FCC32C|nr:HAD-IA family hydrolase [Planktotalea sp.]
MRLRAVIFDVDGTLVDSQADILAAMVMAFQAEGLSPPTRDAVLGIVGLSLDVALPILAPDSDHEACTRMVQGYKDAYVEVRREKGAKVSSPLYSGAREALDRLQKHDDVLLGVATGKSRRGLDKLIEAYELEGVFLTRQVADDHPSKPNPSMLFQAMRDLGLEANDTVMIGDTSFDMEMARAAGVHFIGVAWGYHDVARLADADVIIDDFAQLDAALETVWSNSHV